MGAAAAKKPDESKALAERRSIAEELLGIEQRHAPLFSRMKGLKKSLIAIATAGGENFQELFGKIGVVRVNRAKPSEVKGEVPDLDAAAFLALTDRDRQRLIDKGVVKMVESKTGAYYGGVTVDLF